MCIGVLVDLVVGIEIYVCNEIWIGEEVECVSVCFVLIVDWFVESLFGCMY